MRRIMLMGLAIVALAVLTQLSTVAAGKAAADNELGRAVVKFARDQLGKKVGDGQCANLAVAALKTAGAKDTHDFGISGVDRDYRWGTLVERHEDVQPGDIVQFRKVTIVIKTEFKSAKGSGYRIETHRYPHHTSIIARNLGKGKFKVLEQNAGPSKSQVERQKVQENDLNLSHLTEGKVWIYRPVKK